VLRIFAVFIFVLPMQLVAEEKVGKEPDVVVFNYGLHKCESFIKTIDSKNKNKINGFKLWLGGYLTNYSVFLAYQGRLLKKITLDTVVNDLYEICKKDKNQYFSDASSELMVKYIGDKTKTSKYKPSYISESCDCKAENE